jgi:hypothetical protein
VELRGSPMGEDFGEFFAEGVHGNGGVARGCFAVFRLEPLDFEAI